MLRSFQHLAKTFSRSLYPTGMLSCEALQKRTPSLSSMNFQRDMTRRAILASLRFSFRPTTAKRSAGMEGETVKKFRIGDRKSTRLTQVTNAHLVCRLLLEKKKQT